MKNRRTCSLARVVIVACCALLCSSAFAKEKEKATPGTKMVDSGAFGIFSNGTRVATETFSIQQSATGSLISSQFKASQGEQVAEQTSELELSPAAELRNYTWNSTAPEKVNATVVPSEAFLVEVYTLGADGKPHDQNFLLPASTVILDDYFFVQREVLAWRYLASACKSANGVPACPVHQKAQFGTLNPHARMSMSVSVEFAGRDKITVHGTEAEYSKFLLTSEGEGWAFWLDEHQKLVRMVNETGTEVVRD